MFKSFRIGQVAFEVGADDVRPFSPWPYPTWSEDIIGIGWAGVWVLYLRK